MILQMHHVRLQLLQAQPDRVDGNRIIQIVKGRPAGAIRAAAAFGGKLVQYC